MRSVAAPLFTPRQIAEARSLIESQDLRFEEDFHDLIGVYDPDGLAAVAARSGYVLKMFAIRPDAQGGELLGLLIDELVRLGAAAGEEALLVYTKPEHASSFERFNFSVLVASRAAVLLEYGDGLARYLDSYAALRSPGRNGAIVVNGNPFTLGHLHLARSAAQRVERLHIFVVREDRSAFPFVARERLIREATAEIPNIVVLETSRYAISAATFPSYFLREIGERVRVQMEIDLRLFATRIAPPFGVRVRFAGEEPYCQTTAAYNQAMREVLPDLGVEFVEIPRAAVEGRFISATRVRELLAEGDLDAIAPLVPEPTWAYLRSEEGAAIARRLAAQNRRSPA